MFKLTQLGTEQMQAIEDGVPEKYIGEVGWTDELGKEDLARIAGLDIKMRRQVMDAIRIDPEKVPFEGDKSCDNPDCDNCSSMTGFVLMGESIMEVCLFCQGLTATVTDGSARMPKDSSFWDARFLA